jgi:DNA-binding transcriptional LysR family regulator
MKEGIDVAFRLGIIEDSSLRMRGIMACERVLVAAPEYLAARGEPTDPQELVQRRHHCLMLRYSGAREYLWTLQMPTGPRKFEVHGPYDTDDGDVLTDWALSGRGIINKPRFEVEPFIRDGRLKVILSGTPPTPVQFAAVYPHKKLQDPKVRLLLDFMAERCQRLINDLLAGK